MKSLPFTQPLLIDSTEAMLDLASKFSVYCQPGDLIFLEGSLGAGKTTFARGFLRALGYQGSIKSPTYPLVESYPLPSFIVHHFDLYRIKSLEELQNIGFEGYVHPDSICLIEWPAYAAQMGYYPTCQINIQPLKDARQIKFLTHDNEIKAHKSDKPQSV